MTHFIPRTLAAACLILATLPALAADPIKLDAKFDATTMADKLMKTNSSGNQYVRGIKRVAIGSFDVEFATKGSSSATSTQLGSGNNNRATSSTYMALGGVNEADFQAIVDQVYAKFVADLAATGVEVVGYDKVMATEAWRKLASGGKPAPLQKSGGNESSTVVTPEGRPVTGIALATKGGVLSALSNMSAITGSMFSGPDMAKELDATVINVRMVVRFVEMTSSNSSFFGRISGSATVESKISPTIVAGDTVVNIFSAQGGGVFTLETPLQIDQSAFVGVKDVTSTSSKATMVGLAVLSMAMGKGDSNSIKEYEAVADPVKYRELVGGGLGQVSSMMVAQLKTLR